MATKNTEAAPERVKVQIPRARKGEDPNFFVGINGVNYIMPKGETVEVPPEVAYEIERARAAEDYMFDQSDELKSKG
jgi:hypothetical protein